jgi:hypothetical protein
MEQVPSTGFAPMPPEIDVDAHSRREAPDRSLAQDLAALASADVGGLKAQFRQLYRRPAPESLSRDLLARLVAHGIQERRLGGLDRELALKLDRLAQGLPSRRRLKAGTVLVREHEGTMHEVVIVPGGYLWNGQSFTSLSTIAKRITGTSWNGPRFFGLRSNRSAVSEVRSHA